MKHRLCVIPARGGSVRIPGKNTKPFKGVPMLERAIRLARASDLFDVVLVTTDDMPTVRLAEMCGARAMLRAHDDGTKGTVDVTRETALAFKEAARYAPFYLMCLYPCTPLLTVEDLIESFDRHWIHERWHTIAIGGNPIRDAGAFYWHTWGPLMRHAPLVDRQHTGFYVLPDERVCDINVTADWERAEHLYEEMQHGNAG